MPVDSPAPAAGGRVLVVTATAAEARALRRGVGSVLVTGIGAAAAGQALAQALGADTAGIVSVGTAAGLRPGLPAGTVVLPPAVIAADGRRHVVDAAWRQSAVATLSDRVPVCGDTLVQADTPLTTSAQKAALFARWSAGAADMESARIAAFAAEHHLPCLVVRVVLDPADAGLPVISAAGVDAAGQLTPGRLLAALAGRPLEAAALWRLARQFRIAARALSVVAAALNSIAAPGGIPGAVPTRPMS